MMVIAGMAIWYVVKCIRYRSGNIYPDAGKIRFLGNSSNYGTRTSYFEAGKVYVFGLNHVNIYLANYDMLRWVGSSARCKSL